MHRSAYILLALTTLFWAGNAVAGKLAVGHISPMLLNLVRWVAAAVVLGLLARDKLRGDWPAAKRNAGLLLALGFSGMTVFSGGLYFALLSTSAINASIMQASMPLVVFVVSFLMYGTKTSLGQAAGFVLSLIGVAITVSHGDLWRLSEMDLNRGDAVMVVAIISYGLYTVALRRRPAMHWQTFMFALMVAAAVTSMPPALIEWWAGRSGWPTPQGWAITAFVGIFPSLLAQVFFVRGVELIGPNRAGLFLNLVPIFGTLLSILILGETFHLYHALALVLVLGGIGLAEAKGGSRDGR
ncbi:MAG: DMT family transporter [Rhizobiaceae bacterium]